jgi:hypothetical protein
VYSTVPSGPVLRATCELRADVAEGGTEPNSVSSSGSGEEPCEPGDIATSPSPSCSAKDASELSRSLDGTRDSALGAAAASPRLAVAELDDA